jgi:hypothetical protein
MVSDICWGYSAFRSFEMRELFAGRHVVTSQNTRIFIDTEISHVRGGADKSLARPGRKQAIVTTLGIYSTCSPRSSIHFSARCSKFCKPIKKKKKNRKVVLRPGLRGSNDLPSDENWRPFNCFFSPGNRW